ncbi:glutamate synthase-related protein [Thioalkalivibrio sp. ALR17-21]|uniref:glutamate synthase-related protein n=1 Tax=Thioalkalivibrio sp. ALR17-21 TaxID=1269813 RepID=UPI000401D1FE|nr:glutamate synthase-related protein [Thioalkalivibrio sp. ALR17-21]
MSRPVIAALEPRGVELEKGEEYYFCRCGRSANQPFCDGSHAGTGLGPLAFTAQEDGEAFLCQCKQSGNLPYCDGTHAGLDAQVGEAPEPASEPGGNAGNDAGDGAGGSDAPPDPRATATEPHVEFIHALARDGLEGLGAHGPTVAMGVPRDELPSWDALQLLAAQLSSRPLEAGAEVAAELVIGPQAQRPLRLSMPWLVTDMSYGSLSREARMALARGAEQAGTGVCSGEGGMLPEETEVASRYLFELGPAHFGYDDSVPERVQAFHFKAGQAAKTGVGGVLPGCKVSDEIAQARGIEAGRDAVSPPADPGLRTPEDFRRFADDVRQRSGGIPVGFKLAAHHIEADIDFALDAGADYIILDGRGGGTGAAPALLRDHMGVPTIPALARARRHMDATGASGRVTLLVTGGLRTPADWIKALALGADGVALGNAALQAIGCVGARICHTNRCPTGVATQDPQLRARLDVETGAARLGRFLTDATELARVLARACGHARLEDFGPNDLSTFDRDLARLAGVQYAGVRDARHV